MRKSIIILLLLLPIANILLAQQHDDVWLFGANSFFPDPNWGTCLLDFNMGNPQAFQQGREMSLDVTVSSICDSTGNLLLYTNGNYIANFTNEMVENGDSLNPGEITWDHYPYGLGIAQSHIFLPMPGHLGRYYLFHENLDYHDDLILAVNPCYYSEIDMNQNNGLGKVEEKNVVIFEDSTKTFGTMTAVKHANGRDWWVLFPEKAENVFYRFLFSPNGVEDLLIQELTPNFPSIFSNGFISFSPDGSKLARFEVQHGLYLYDFDRCTGLLEDSPMFVPIPGTQLGGGVAFSPNGRFLYMASSTFILQADMWANDIAASLDTVAVYDGFFDPNTLPTTFFAMQPGPDGRIYLNTNNSTRYLHYINQPNNKGEDCEVVQHGVELPYVNIFTTQHFPNFRLGPLDGSPCDTLGLDNRPLAGFRWEVDTVQPLRVQFIDNSFYEPTEWLWDFGGPGGSTEVDPLHQFPATGTYTVCLTVSNPYDSDTVCKEVTVEGVNGVGEVVRGSSISVHPNPAKNSVTIKFADKIGQGQQVGLFNLFGQMLLAHDLPEGGLLFSFDISDIPSGIYFLKVFGNGQEKSTVKLVVSK